MLTFATIKTYPDLNGIVGLEIIMWIFGTASLLGAVFALTILPETRGRSLDDIEMKFCNNSDIMENEACKISNLWSQPKNITLQRFTSIAEEKQSNIVANAYIYDNFCLELAPESLDKDTNKDTKASQTESSQDHQIVSIALEHVCL